MRNIDKVQQMRTALGKRRKEQDEAGTGLNMEAAEDDYRDAQVLHASKGLLNNIDVRDADSPPSSLDSLDNDMFGPGEKQGG